MRRFACFSIAFVLATTGCSESSVTDDAGVTDEGDDTETGNGDEISDGTEDGSGSADSGDPCGGCDDDDPCTEDTCQADGSCTFQPIVDNTCRPTIEVTFPIRGSTVQLDAAQTELEVTGSVSSGLGTITSLTVNDVAVDVGPNGQFVHSIPVQYGGNILRLAAMDDAGHARERVQSFVASSDFRLPTSSGEGMSPLGLGIYLDQEALDQILAIGRIKLQDHVDFVEVTSVQTDRVADLGLNRSVRQVLVRALRRTSDLACAREPKQQQI